MRPESWVALAWILSSGCSSSSELLISPDELEARLWATQEFSLRGLRPRAVLESDGRNLRPAHDLVVSIGPSTATVLSVGGEELRVRLEGPLDLGRHDVTVHALGVDHRAAQALLVWAADGGATLDASSGPRDAADQGGADGEAGRAGADAGGDVDAGADAGGDVDAGADAGGDVDGGEADAAPAPLCLTDEECDDGVFCNGRETCAGDHGCSAGARPSCDDGVSCTEDRCETQTDTCTSTPSDASCDDGLACTGVETCDPIADCRPGTPITCDDGIACTTDRCDEPDGTCRNPPDHGLCPIDQVCLPGLGGCREVWCWMDVQCTDAVFCNGVGWCDGVRCHAGPPPVCDDGLACSEDVCVEDVQACVSAAPDADLDGFGDAGCAGNDCDDRDPTVHPGATESCDGIDEDCDGAVDEGFGVYLQACEDDAECCSGRCDGGSCGVEHCRLDPNCGGGVGGRCLVDQDCLEGDCCAEDDCGGGTCTYPCDADFDCPSDMLCMHSRCFFTCTSADDCAPGMQCAHGGTICEWL